MISNNCHLIRERIVGRNGKRPKRKGGREGGLDKIREILSTATSTQIPNNEITKKKMTHKQTTQ